MQELVKLFPAYDIHDVRITREENYIKGLQFTHHTRLLLFEKSQGTLLIDFMPEEIIADRVYIIPSLHFHYVDIAETSRFICIDISNKKLTNYHKKLIYSIKYRWNEELVKPHNSYPLLFDTLNDILLVEVSAISILKLVTEVLVQSLDLELYRATLNKNDAHIKTADKFLQALQNQNLSLNTCSLQSLSALLSCSERTLSRNCLLAFGCNVKDIVKYHVLIKAAFQLLENKTAVISIAKDLGFADISSFDKYFKRLSGHTPSDTRKKLQAIIQL